MNMRFLSLLLFVALGLVAHVEPAQATISEVQRCTGFAGGTTNPTCTLTGAANGNLIVVAMGSVDGDPASFTGATGTGSCSGSFTFQGSTYVDPGGVAFWTFKATSTANCVVTLNKGGNNTPVTMVAYELTGWDGTTPTDGASTFANGTGTSLTVAMTTTTVAEDFLIGGIVTSDTTNVTFTTPTTGWTASATTNNTNIKFNTETRITSSAGSYTAGWGTISNAFGRSLNVGALAIRGVPTTPTITSTSPAPLVSNGATLTLNGSNLKAAGNSTVTFGGTSQTVTTQSATAPQITVARGTNKYGVGLNLILTDSNAVASNTFSTTGIQPQSGWSYVNLTTPASSGLRITAVADLASGDQLAYDNVSGTVTVFADGTFVANPTVTSFSVEAWTTGSGWGTPATQTINAGTPSPTQKMFLMFPR